MDAIRQDTIFALASGQLPAGIAIVRISGRQTRFVIETICGTVGEPRMTNVRDIRSADGQPLDRGLVIWFPGPANFTGEDYAELHLHGGRAVVEAVFDTLRGFETVRQAEPGEFTMRAYQNGRIDLTEAEALADLVQAETERQRLFAITNGSGLHDRLYETWRDCLVDMLSGLTAIIDFPDEEDAADDGRLESESDIAGLLTEIDSHIKRFRSGEILRKGFRVAIVGEPNVGKSSLLNAMAGRDVAIVSEIPGTTRDVIEVALDLGGYKVVLSDTAGIRDSDEKIEKIGIGKAIETSKSADLVLMLGDAGKPCRRSDMVDLNVPIVEVGTKIDLAKRRECASEYSILISTVDQTGLDDLAELLRKYASDAVGKPETIPFRRRHLDLLRETRDSLTEYLGHRDELIELKAESLRQACHSLGRITGRVDVEDLLDVIFSRFCIGK